MQGPVLVTGAAGFAGRHLVERLVGTGPVVACGRRASAPAVPGSTWVQLDLLDRAAVRGAMRDIRPSIVYHCAGYPHVAESWSDRLTPLATNVLATHHLFDALERAGAAARVLVTGSAAVYAASPTALSEEAAVAPTSPYATSKLAQEALALHAGIETGLEVIVTRSFNHTGPRQSPAFFAPGMARQIALIEAGVLPPVIKVGNLDARRDLSDVRDVVEAYLHLMTHAEPGVYNVASGRAHSMREVLDLLVGQARVEVRVEVDPERLRPNDVPYLVGDPSRLQRATGWQPAVPLATCLADLLSYWRTVVRIGEGA